jgi:hypothetical protein
MQVGQRLVSSLLSPVAGSVMSCSEPVSSASALS